MKASTETSLAAIFHRLAEFLRKTGELGIFDTLVHNYRLRESLSLSDEDLQKFTNDLQLLFSAIQNFINSNAQLTLSGDSVSPSDTAPAASISRGCLQRQPVENSIEINPGGRVAKNGMNDLGGSNPGFKLAKSKAVENIQKPENSESEAHQIVCCKLCSKAYKSLDLFNKHTCSKRKLTNDAQNSIMITDTAEIDKMSRISCGTCLQSITTLDRLLSHLSVFCKERYTCEVCELNKVESLPEFESLQLLNRHKRTAHPDSKCHFCNECDLSFQSNQSLQKHKRRKHHGKKESFACGLCSATFERSIQLTTHKMKEHSSEAKNCDQCGISCASDSALAAHITQKHGPGDTETDTSSSKFECSFCPKRFPRKDKLEFHLRTHTGQKPFICASCGKGFSRKYKLEDHEARHLGVKKYVCKNSGCDKAYASNADLKIHIRNQHPEAISASAEIVATRKKRLRKPRTSTKSKRSNTAIDTDLPIPIPSFQHIGTEPEAIPEQYLPLPEKDIQYGPLDVQAIGLEQPPFEYSAESEQIAAYPNDSYFVSDTVHDARYDFGQNHVDGDQFQSAIPDDYANFYQRSESHAPTDNFYNQPYVLDPTNTVYENQQLANTPFEHQTLESSFPIAENCTEIAQGQVYDQYGGTGAENPNMFPQYESYDYVYQRETGLHSAANYASAGLEAQFHSYENHFQASVGSGSGVASATVACAEFSVGVGLVTCENMNSTTFYS